MTLDDIAQRIEEHFPKLKTCMQSKEDPNVIIFFDDEGCPRLEVMITTNRYGTQYELHAREIFKTLTDGENNEKED